MLPRVGASQEADMGLLDILNSVPAGGVSNDPRARAAPPGQGMSPTAKALLALLAIYAMKNLRRADAPACQADKAAPSAAGLATCCAAHWAEFSAAPPPERCSTAGLAACSSNFRRAVKTTPRVHGSAAARTRRSRRATSRTRSEATRSTNCPSRPE